MERKKLKWMSFYKILSCVRSEDVGPEIFGPQLETRVKQMLTDLIPLYDYFNQFTE